jgi:hypothetical protein
MMSGEGLRGQDQLWYAHDIQTVVAGQPKVGNEVYPRPFLQNHRVNTPLMHNTLCLYCIAAACKILGIVRGWHAAMALAMILAGACTACIAYSLTRRRDVAFWTYAVCLLNPLTVWQSMNLLMEPFYGMLMALATLQYVTAGKCRLRWTLLLVTLALAVQCRPIFLPLLLGLPLAFLFHAARPLQLKNLLVAAGFLFLGCGSILVSRLLFDSALPPTLADNIRCSGPGKTMAEYYFVLDPPPVDAKLLWGKFLWAMQRQFLSLDWQAEPALPLFWLYNVTIAGSLALLVLSLRDSRARRERRLAFLACLVFAIHMAFNSLHHAQLRTCLVFLAPQLACAAVLAARFRPLTGRKFAAALSAILLLFVCADVVATFKARGDAAALQYELEALAENLAVIPSRDRVMFESLSGTNYLPVTYATHPRPTLVLSHVHPYPTDTYRTLQGLFKAKWLICLPSSSLPALWGAERVPLTTPLRGKTSDLAIYRLRSGGSTTHND